MSTESNKSYDVALEYMDTFAYGSDDMGLSSRRSHRRTTVHKIEKKMCTLSNIM